MVAPALGVIASCLLLLTTIGLDRGVPEGRLGPAFWPRLVLACLAATCLVRLAGALVARAAAVEAGPGAMSRARLGAAVALILLYVLVTPVAGFPLATAGFIASFMWVSGARSAVGIAAAAGPGTIGLLYLFVKAVYLPLPKGDGPFEVVTLALYRALRIF